MTDAKVYTRTGRAGSSFIEDGYDKQSTAEAKRSCGRRIFKVVEILEA